MEQCLLEMRKGKDRERKKDRQNEKGARGKTEGVRSRRRVEA
jgi:hypothetical protein